MALNDRSRQYGTSKTNSCVGSIARNCSNTHGVAKSILYFGVHDHTYIAVCTVGMAPAERWQVVCQYCAIEEWPAEVVDAFNEAVNHWQFENRETIKGCLFYGAGYYIWSCNHFGDQAIQWMTENVITRAETAMELGAVIYALVLLKRIPEKIREPYTVDEHLSHDDEGWELTPKGPMKAIPK